MLDAPAPRAKRCRMLPLAGHEFPKSTAALAESILAGLKNHGLTARSVRADGGEFPEIHSLHIDLSGATVNRNTSPTTSGAATDQTLAVATLGMVAQPLIVESIPAQIELHAHGARFAFSRADSGALALVLTGAAEGSATVSAERLDLETLAHQLVGEAAAKQGVQIKKTRLELTQRGPRSVGFRAEVTAKMFVMSAKLAVTGNLDIDDQFNARLSGLSCAGDGMIASAANAFLKPHFQSLEGRTFALLSFSLGGVELRDLSIDAGETLRLSARFGERAK